MSLTMNSPLMVMTYSRQQKFDRLV